MRKDMQTGLEQKVSDVAEELGVDEYLSSVGAFDPKDLGIPEDVNGFYSPEMKAVGINKDCIGTDQGNSTLIHELTHSLQDSKRYDYNFKPGERVLYSEFMEAQASKYTPFESPYPHLESIYDIFMEGYEKDYFPEEFKDRYGQVYEALSDCEDVLEDADFEEIFTGDFGLTDSNYETTPGNETY